MLFYSYISSNLCKKLSFLVIICQQLSVLAISLPAIATSCVVTITSLYWATAFVSWNINIQHHKCIFICFFLHHFVFSNFKSTFESNSRYYWMFKIFCRLKKNESILGIYCSFAPMTEGFNKTLEFRENINFDKSWVCKRCVSITTHLWIIWKYSVLVAIWLVSVDTNCIIIFTFTQNKVNRT